MKFFGVNRPRVNVPALICLYDLLLLGQNVDFWNSVTLCVRELNC